MSPTIQRPKGLFAAGCRQGRIHLPTRARFLKFQFLIDLLMPAKKVRLVGERKQFRKQPPEVNHVFQDEIQNSFIVALVIIGIVKVFQAFAKFTQIMLLGKLLVIQNWQVRRLPFMLMFVAKMPFLKGVLRNLVLIFPS